MADVATSSKEQPCRLRLPGCARWSIVLQRCEVRRRTDLPASREPPERCLRSIDPQRSAPSLEGRVDFENRHLPLAVACPALALGTPLAKDDQDDGTN